MLELKNFVLERKIVHGAGSAYIGKIDGKDAVVVIHKQTVHGEVFNDLLKAHSELVQQNDVYYSYRADTSMPIRYRVIYPATEAHMIKYSGTEVYIRETYEEYKRILEKNVIVPSHWMENVLGGRECVDEVVYYSDNEFMVLSDYDWDKRSVQQLHLLVIFRDSGLRTIREVRDHRVLERAHEKVLKVLGMLGLSEEEVFMFFHYRPTYYRLHLHVVHIHNGSDVTASAVRAVPFFDVLHNVKMCPEYYERDLYVCVSSGSMHIK
jgi:m7GpppX diphosphatase